MPFTLCIYTVMGTDPFSWIGNLDPDPQFVTRYHSRYYLYIQLIRFYFIILNNIYVGIIQIVNYFK